MIFPPPPEGRSLAPTSPDYPHDEGLTLQERERNGYTRQLGHIYGSHALLNVTLSFYCSCLLKHKKKQTGKNIIRQSLSDSLPKLDMLLLGG